MEPVIKILIVFCTNDETLRDGVLMNALANADPIDEFDFSGHDLDDETSSIITAGIDAAERLEAPWLVIETQSDSNFQNWHGGKYSPAPLHITYDIAQSDEDGSPEWNYQGKLPTWLHDVIQFDVILKAMNAEAKTVAERLVGDERRYAKGDD